MIRFRLQAVVILFLLAFQAPAIAFMAPERIELSLGVAVQREGSPMRTLCRDSVMVEGRFNAAMWVVAVADPATAGIEVSCGSGALEQAAAKPGEQAEAPAWSAGLSTTVRLVRRMEDEQNLHVEVSASIQRRTGTDPHADMAIEEITLERVELGRFEIILDLRCLPRVFEENR